MKFRKKLLPLLLILVFMFSIVPFTDNSVPVHAGDWEPCAHCGEYRSPDYLCDTCGGCGIETCNDCFLEHHCPCGACELDIPICNDCRQCLDCVGGFICSECDLCPDCVGFDEYCTSCYKCAMCMGMGYCYECNRCGDCTDLCPGEDCHRCHECCDRFCPNCGLCDLCAYDTFCNDCGLCGNCFTGPICSNCNLCSDCARVCIGCEDCCEHCAIVCTYCCECEDCLGMTICPDCNGCTNCTGATQCENCGLCSNCTNVCEECGEVCDGCAAFCQECNRCENCVELCPGCGEYCSECKRMCEGCGCCSECINLCEGCEEFCDDCLPFCLDCNQCEYCVGPLCDNCEEHCSYCMDTCGNCGWCSECAFICQDCGEVCDNCGTLCSDCREYCSDCRHLCEDCGACSECANLCDNCEEFCDDCASFCLDCNRCEHCVNLCEGCEEVCDGCVSFCHDCNRCENCVNLCSECGEVCDDCASFCIRCNQCENCVNLCSACEQVCDNCEPFCQGCNTGACCAYICPNCGEFCTECQSDWTYKSLDNIQHQWQCSCGAPLEEPESHCFIYEVRKAATATEAGFGELKCDLCNYKERVAIPATGVEEHSHNFSFWVSERSSHEKYCACGANDPLTKGAHEFQWVTDIEATIEDPGLKHQECTVCGYQLPGETIPPIEHTHVYETTWSSDYTGHWHACSCGHKSDEASHAMGEWIVTSAPTETKPGSKERVCNICNYKQTQVIPSMATDLTVTFDSNGGSTVPAQSVVNGGKAVKPEDPSRPGYVFTGWCTTASGTTAWNFEHAIYEATTLYARWALEETPEPPAILTESLKQAIVGSSYNEILQASGSTPITWSIIDGKLPNGLILNSTTGKISGKPTEDGLFTIVMIAENKYDADIKSYTLTSSIRSSGGGGGGGGFVAGISSPAIPKPELPPAVDKTDDFIDVPENEWYYEPVKMACEKGWFSGTSDTTFSPDTAMTRGMIVTVLWRIEGRPAAQAKSFNDVAADKYYSTAVAWAAEHGIVSGYGNDVFGPDDSITREQMAVMLYNYAKYKGYDLSASGDLSKFVDRNKTTEYAVNAIKWAVGSGIINGKGGSILDPTGNSTRAEVATMLMKFLPR